ncbi:MAG: hypothetical protein NVSMB56_07640 [Pyrinomonadaceae bacterium]
MNFMMPLDGLWILLVEDEQDIREFETILLESYGIHVTAASTTAEAFSLLTKEDLDEYPDLLISDITMPEEDGCAFIKKVRKFPHEVIKHIPAIALTSLNTHEDRKKILAAGFHLHIVKPPDPEDLAVQIAKLTGRALNS